MWNYVSSLFLKRNIFSFRWAQNNIFLRSRPFIPRSRIFPSDRPESLAKRWHHCHIRVLSFAAKYNGQFSSTYDVMLCTVYYHELLKPLVEEKYYLWIYLHLKRCRMQRPFLPLFLPTSEKSVVFWTWANLRSLPSMQSPSLCVSQCRSKRWYWSREIHLSYTGYHQRLT
jgi:hypothetical protein